MYWFMKIKHLQENLEIQNRKRQNPRLTNQVKKERGTIANKEEHLKKELRKTNKQKIRNQLKKQ